MFTRHQDPLRGLLAARRDLGSEAVKIVCAALMLALIVLAWRITSALV